MSFPRYPAYKPSGVEWLGEVPEHWDKKPLKAVASINDEVLPESLPPDREIEYVDIASVSLMNGIERTETLLFAEAPSRARRIPRDGDVLVSTVRTYLKAIAPVISPPINLVASTGFAVVRPRTGLHPGYLKYALQEEHFVQQVISKSTGVSYPAINASDVAKIFLCLPDLAEQIAIASFLDRETAKIDALISEQQRLIELLQEKRQAVISHAVTKGLNPHAPMKDSGVEWLGEVPEHWEVGALSYALGAVGDVDHYMPETVQEGVPYVMTGDLKPLASQIDFEGCKQVADQDYKRLSRKIKTAMGDLIMARYATIGTVAYVDVEREFLVSYSCVTIKPDISKAVGRYLFFCLKSDSFFKGIQQRVNTNTQQNIGIGDLRRVKVALPPLNEQLEIVKHLQAQASEMDGVIKASKDTVELLKERRSALISAAVTGQIDVRGLVSEAAVA